VGYCEERGNRENKGGRKDEDSPEGGSALNNNFRDPCTLRREGWPCTKNLGGKGAPNTWGFQRARRMLIARDLFKKTPSKEANDF